MLTPLDIINIYDQIIVPDFKSDTSLSNRICKLKNIVLRVTETNDSIIEVRDSHIICNKNADSPSTAIYEVLKYALVKYPSEFNHLRHNGNNTTKNLGWLLSRLRYFHNNEFCEHVCELVEFAHKKMAYPTIDTRIIDENKTRLIISCDLEMLMEFDNGVWNAIAEHFDGYKLVKYVKSDTSYMKLKYTMLKFLYNKRKLRSYIPRPPKSIGQKNAHNANRITELVNVYREFYK